MRNLGINVTSCYKCGKGVLLVLGKILDAKQGKKNFKKKRKKEGPEECVIAYK